MDKKSNKTEPKFVEIISNYDDCYWGCSLKDGKRNGLGYVHLKSLNTSYISNFKNDLLNGWTIQLCHNLFKEGKIFHRFGWWENGNLVKENNTPEINGVIKLIVNVSKENNTRKKWVYIFDKRAIALGIKMEKDVFWGFLFYQDGSVRVGFLFNRNICSIKDDSLIKLFLRLSELNKCFYERFNNKGVSTAYKHFLTREEYIKVIENNKKSYEPNYYSKRDLMQDAMDAFEGDYDLYYDWRMR